jgi:hypothetical protein
MHVGSWSDCSSPSRLGGAYVQLGFVDAVSGEGASVTLVLRLPTYWCSPNFAYLMASDARQRALDLPGVESVDVILKDHAHAAEISVGASAGRPFADVFPGEASGDLDELRARFQSKVFGMRQEQLVRFLAVQAVWRCDVGALSPKLVGPSTSVGCRRAPENAAGANHGHRL